jgi:hypothetical protein
MKTGKEILSERMANGRALIASDKHRIKRPLDPRMSAGEKMIWAAAYTDEYRRATLGMEPYTRRFEIVEAARFAMLHAAKVVGAARGCAINQPAALAAIDNFCEERGFLLNMLVNDKDAGDGKSRRR